MTVADNHQQVNLLTRIVRPLDECAQPDIQVRAASAVQFDLPGSKDLAHVANGGIAARDDDVCAVPELADQARQLRQGSRQM
jgi:hypothetical protein